jgi:hypothetical protein
MIDFFCLIYSGRRHSNLKIEIKNHQMDVHHWWNVVDALVSYLISSSASMSDTVNVLASDPRNTVQVNCLNEQINKAKVLMTLVIRYYIILILVFLSSIV